jgi:hypothetical protein
MSVSKFENSCCTLATCIWDWYASDNNLPGIPRVSWKKPNASKSATCRLWTADANSHIPCRFHTVPLPRPAVALRDCFQNGIFVAWQGNGTACVNRTAPHCVNQMGKTQSKPLVERDVRGTAWYVCIRLYEEKSLPTLHYTRSVTVTGFFKEDCGGGCFAHMPIIILYWVRRIVRHCATHEAEETQTQVKFYRRKPHRFLQQGKVKEDVLQNTALHFVIHRYDAETRAIMLEADTYVTAIHLTTRIPHNFSDRSYRCFGSFVYQHFDYTDPT